VGVALVGAGPASPAAHAQGAATFKQQFLVLNDDLVYFGDLVGHAVNTASDKSDRQLAYGFDLFARELRGLQRRAGRLRPPQSVAAPYRRFGRSMTPVIRDLRAISRAARNHDPRAARRASVALANDSATLRSARRAMVRAVR
jgi:hypothetical protein